MAIQKAIDIESIVGVSLKRFRWDSDTEFDEVGRIKYRKPACGKFRTCRTDVGGSRRAVRKLIGGPTEVVPRSVSLGQRFVM